MRCIVYCQQLAAHASVGRLYVPEHTGNEWAMQTCQVADSSVSTQRGKSRHAVATQISDCPAAPHHGLSSGFKYSLRTIRHELAATWLHPSGNWEIPLRRHADAFAMRFLVSSPPLLFMTFPYERSLASMPGKHCTSCAGRASAARMACTAAFSNHPFHQCRRGGAPKCGLPLSRRTCMPA